MPLCALVLQSRETRDLRQVLEVLSHYMHRQTIGSCVLLINPFRPRSPILLKLSELVYLSPNTKSEAQFFSNPRWRREIPNWNFKSSTFLERSQRRTLIDKILILFAKDNQVCLLWAVKFTGINSNSLASRFHFYSEPSKISIFSNWPTLEHKIF